jgi:hypothetical protein
MPLLNQENDRKFMKSQFLGLLIGFGIIIIMTD